MSNLKIVFLDSFTMDPNEIDFSPLNALGTLTTYPRTELSDVIERSMNADVLITNKCLITREAIEALPQLKMIQLAATGYNNVDIDAAKSKNIRVCNVAGYSTESVTQHVFAMLLAYFNKVEYYNTEVKKGRWSKSLDFSFWDSPISELVGLNFGILGYGKIGRSVANVAAAFGMNVLVAHKYSVNSDHPNVQFFDQNHVFTNADILSLHAPLNDSTSEIINAVTLDSMKKNLILINTARGGLINESELANELAKGSIQAALLDVLTQEPPNEQNPLIGLSNCIITPHQAWANLNARKRLLNGMSENIRAFMDDEAINVIA